MKNEEFLNYLYNRLLPEYYRIEDSKNGFPFKRYLKSLVDGGYSSAIKKSNDFSDLTNPMKCPQNFLPKFFESFGFEFQRMVEDRYYRKFLSEIGFLAQRRGSYSFIKYLSAQLLGYNVDLYYERSYNELEECDRHLVIVFHTKDTGEVVDNEENIAIARHFIQMHLPFYMTFSIFGNIPAQEINYNIYNGSVLIQSKEYTIGG
jgi:hypothetical protein